METIYDVKTRFSVDPSGAKSIDGLVSSTKELDRATSRVTDGFGRIAAAATAAFGISGAAKALIGFNAHVESAKIGLSAMLEGNLGGSWETATKNASALYDEFQRFSTLTPVTTNEIMEFGKGVAVSTFQAGGSIRDLTKITEQGVIAAKAFGYGTAYSALELSEMLAGNVNKRMMFAKQILGMAHVDEQKFNAMGGADRVKLVEKVLGSDAMKNAAQAFGNSWDGVTSTLKDKLMIMVGKVGLPLFKALTAEVKNWNEWIDNNTSKIEAFGHTLSSALVTGFGVVKSAVSFLVDHASLLLKIGEVWAAVKVGSFLGALGGGGMAGMAGLVQGGRGFFAKQGDAWDKDGNYSVVPAGRGQQNVTGSNIGGNLPLVGAAAMAGVAIGHLAYQALGLADIIDPQKAAYERLMVATGNLDDAMSKASRHLDGKEGVEGSQYLKNIVGITGVRKQMLETLTDIQSGRYDGAKSPYWKAMQEKRLRDSGVFDDDQISKVLGNPSGRAAMMAALQTQIGKGLGQSTIMPGVYAASTGEAFATLPTSLQKMVDLHEVNNEILQYIAMTLASGAKVNEIVVKQFMTMAAIQKMVDGKIADKPNVSVTIQHLEVQSDDPDRMAFGLISAFRDAAKNPSSAFSTLREG